MRHFTWSSENEVFFAQIDTEHREMFHITEELQQAIANGETAEVRRLMEALAAHYEYHFAHEEWLMRSSAYPSYGWHKQQHDTARKRLKLFTPLIESGDAEAADLFLEFLFGWLQDHTTVTDRMMAAHVRNYERTHGAGGFKRWPEPHRPAEAAACLQPRR